MSKVTLNDINVSYDGKTQILKGLNLEIGEGELVSLSLIHIFSFSRTSGEEM